MWRQKPETQKWYQVQRNTGVWDLWVALPWTEAGACGLSPVTLIDGPSSPNSPPQCVLPSQAQPQHLQEEHTPNSSIRCVFHSLFFQSPFQPVLEDADSNIHTLFPYRSVLHTLTANCPRSSTPWDKAFASPAQNSRFLSLLTAVQAWPISTAPVHGTVPTRRMNQTSQSVPDIHFRYLTIFWEQNKFSCKTL